MFKVAKVTSSSLKEARDIMERVRQENPAYWPYGLSADHFDGGCYLIREKSASKPVGFCGFQRRMDNDGGVTGYYSIGILPEYRQNGYAKEAVSKLLAMKSATVDRMKAMIVSSNTPSLRLADALGVQKVVKRASHPVLSLDPNRIIEHPGQLLVAPTDNFDYSIDPNAGIVSKKLRLAQIIAHSLGMNLPQPKLL